MKIVWATLFFAGCLLIILRVIDWATGQPATAFVWVWAVYGQATATLAFANLAFGDRP